MPSESFDLQLLSSWTVCFIVVRLINLDSALSVILYDESQREVNNSVRILFKNILLYEK